MGAEVYGHPPHVPDAVPEARRVKIIMKVLREYGCTASCKQCDHLRSFNGHKAGIAHSEVCRQRIMESVVATTRGAARLGDEDLRINRAIAERIERADTERAQAPGAAVPAALPSGPLDGHIDPPEPRDLVATPDDVASPRARLRRIASEAPQDRSRWRHGPLRPADPLVSGDATPGERQMGFVGGPHPRDAGLRKEPTPPGSPGTGTDRGSVHEDAADLPGRLGSEDAAATEARTAKPKVQEPGNTVFDQPASTRQSAKKLSPQRLRTRILDSSVALMPPNTCIPLHPWENRLDRSAARGARHPGGLCRRCIHLREPLGRSRQCLDVTSSHDLHWV